MKKLRIGYFPLSRNFSVPGDRRRVVFWANARGHELSTNLDDEVDLIFLSEKSDFRYEIRRSRKVPVIFDLIDGYLSPNSFAEDVSRGFAKSLDGSISGRIKPFSHHVRDMCLNSSAVICSSVEQANLIQKHNNNVHVILDSHEEIPFIDFRHKKHSFDQEVRLLWEGQPATFSGLNQVLLIFENKLQFHLELVTDPKYFRYMNRYFQGKTIKLIKIRDSRNLERISLRNWSTQNLSQAASASAIGILPIDLSKPIMRMKPENRMLIMWRMGLPCLVSPLDSFKRVAKVAQVDSVCSSSEDWINQVIRLSTERNYFYDQIERAQNYVQQFHSKEILLAKWDELVRSVMEEK